MQPISPRPINAKEVAVLQAALTRAPLAEVPLEIIQSVSRLTVIGRCDCGCDSVDFERKETTGSIFYRLADAISFSETGEETGVMVWAESNKIVSLEVYNFSDDVAHLPVPESIRSFETAVKK